MVLIWGRIFFQEFNFYTLGHKYSLTLLVIGPATPPYPVGARHASPLQTSS